MRIFIILKCLQEIKKCVQKNILYWDDPNYVVTFLHYNKDGPGNQ